MSDHATYPRDVLNIDSLVYIEFNLAMTSRANFVPNSRKETASEIKPSSLQTEKTLIYMDVTKTSSKQCL